MTRQRDPGLDVESEVCSVLRRSLHLGPELELNAATVLLDDGLALDSVAVLELLLAVETRFRIAIEEHEVTEDRLGTIGSLAELIAEKLRETVADV